MTSYIANGVEIERAVTAFGAICPGTGKIIGIADDLGVESGFSGGLLAQCPHCRTRHELPASALFRMPGRKG